MRPILNEDVPLLFSIDSLTEVKKFLGESPLTNLIESEIYASQCVEAWNALNFGWYVVFEKETNSFIGLCGLHFYSAEFNQRTNFVALRYRFLPQFWGRGFATETAERVLLNYSPDSSNSEVICMVHPQNHSSKNVLKKLGFTYQNNFFSVGDTWEWHSIQLPKR